MNDLNDVLTYPTESDDWVKTVLIGGVLSLFGFLLVPLFLVYGYLVRALRANLEGEPEPPTFDAWGELLVDGLKATIIGFVYMLVPLVVMAVTVGGAVLAMATGSEAGAAAGFGGMMLGFFVTIVLMLLFGYLATVAIVNFAREGRFGAAFDVDVISGVALDRAFAVPWLLSVAVFVAASLVNVVPLIGTLLAVFANFYALVVACALWADGFDEARGAPDVAGRSRVEETPL